ncbi:tripartite tricarboxylate transporter TctB family protein [Aquabacterium sp. A08]|uniref:tripartite tricarboxylate transporter TctB family protein n=1 Tax=Aquabacterium sp. A08 TaxID=2718532 RepID=UPI0014214EC9|nr:tripartite tricarboxylate transporter TctB family protein [Aquabacterium sp. A08]NIC40750.1 tripartite tricarboxylate transporter TctB family protein [Aquabacterium sp. A08]NIC42204.1 tripartite tricarboxylate transporter TctB family protein [Aquabacterium sp. A08]NIC43595.1 tripartite tricarboxylate transporter TctB family protein [Aquabacterium sp. A08]
MAHKDTRDILGGLAMLALGLFAAWYGSSEYEIGDLNRMGPGYFPMALGLLLAALGLFIALPAFFRRGEPIHIEWKTSVLVIASIVVFAVLLKGLGLVLAAALAVLVSSLADREISWRNRLLVAVGVSAITYLVFSVGLSMVLPVWPWSQ